MSALPNGWVEARLADIGELRYGKGLPTSKLLKEGYPVFGANGVIGYYNDYHYEDEQILISCRGANSGTINTSPRRCFVTNNSLVFGAPEFVGEQKKFLTYALMQCDKSQMVTGSAQPQVTIANANEVKIRVAPAAEQVRISRKVDQLLGRSCVLRERLDHIPRLAEKYKEAVLAAAFNEKALAAWGPRRVEDFTADALIGLVRSKEQQSVSQGTPYVRMNHFNMEGVWNDDDLTYVNVTADELRRYELKEGDVLFNTRNSFELVGKVAIWPTGKRQTVYNNNLLRVRFKAGVDPLFAMFQMMSPHFREYLASVKSATTSVCAIYQRSLMAAPFAVPSLEVQKLIASRLQNAMRTIDAFKVQTGHAGKLIDRLNQTILDKAFRGELVPQDPRDEPANSLLKRIKDAREGLASDVGLLRRRS